MKRFFLLVFILLTLSANAEAQMAATITINESNEINITGGTSETPLHYKDLVEADAAFPYFRLTYCQPNSFPYYWDFAGSPWSLQYRNGGEKSTRLAIKTTANRAGARITLVGKNADGTNISEVIDISNAYTALADSVLAYKELASYTISGMTVGDTIEIGKRGLGIFYFDANRQAYVTNGQWFLGDGGETGGYLTDQPAVGDPSTYRVITKWLTVRENSTLTIGNLVGGIGENAIQWSIDGGGYLSISGVHSKLRIYGTNINCIIYGGIYSETFDVGSEVQLIDCVLSGTEAYPLDQLMFSARTVVLKRVTFNHAGHVLIGPLRGTPTLLDVDDVLVNSNNPYSLTVAGHGINTFKNIIGLEFNELNIGNTNAEGSPVDAYLRDCEIPATTLWGNENADEVHFENTITFVVKTTAGVPIVGATVSCPASGWSEITDANGEVARVMLARDWQVGQSPVDYTYTIVVRKNGFRESQFTFQPNVANETKEVRLTRSGPPPHMWRFNR